PSAAPSRLVVSSIHNFPCRVCVQLDSALLASRPSQCHRRRPVCGTLIVPRQPCILYEMLLIIKDQYTCSCGVINCAHSLALCSKDRCCCAVVLTAQVFKLLLLAVLDSPTFCLIAADTLPGIAIIDGSTSHMQ